MARKDKIKTSKTADEIERERLEAKNVKLAKHIDSRPFAEISSSKVLRRSKKKKRINRSKAGNEENKLEKEIKIEEKEDEKEEEEKKRR